MKPHRNQKYFAITPPAPAIMDTETTSQPTSSQIERVCRRRPGVMRSAGFRTRVANDQRLGCKGSGIRHVFLGAVSNCDGAFSHLRRTDACYSAQAQMV